MLCDAAERTNRLDEQVGGISGTGNRGLFNGVQIAASNLTQEQIDMLNTKEEAVDSRTFISLVRKAVEENWIASGVLRNEN